MPAPLVQNRSPQKSWRGLSLLFLSLLPLLAIFHLVMWFAFTRTLFRPETGSSKRIGYLVGLEDCQGKLEAAEPQTGFTNLDFAKLEVKEGTRFAYFGDSFGGEIAKACSLQWHEPVGGLRVNWSQKNGLSQIMEWVRSGWFRDHGVKVLMVERVECEWLDTFSDPGDSTLNVPIKEVRTAGGLPPAYEKAVPWTFANNGNFKVVMYNFAYLFSPTAWDQTDTCVVHLDRDFFNCSYSRLLLFYKGDLTRGVCNVPKNLPRFEQAIANVKALSDLCHEQGIQFYLMVPPNKSTIYYPWVIKPFYAKSKTLDMLQERAAPYGYVDLQAPFHEKLEAGTKDFYLPDDLHWAFGAAQEAARVITQAGAGPKP